MANYLIISDLQIPFHHPKALDFCLKLKKYYKVSDDNVYCVGDETDQYFGSLFKKDPNATMTPVAEIQASIEELKKWYKVFPRMKVCTSNHGTRWQRKATDAEIPSMLLRRYEEMIQAPASWSWKRFWLVDAKHRFAVEHGDNWGGSTPHYSAALHNGISTVIGHHHSVAGVEYLKTEGQSLWGAAAGCLIDFEQYAFDYARAARRKPVIGTTVVCNDGALPIFIPIDSV